MTYMSVKFHIDSAGSFLFFFLIFSHRESFFVCKPFVVDFPSHSSVFDPIDPIYSKLFDVVAAAELSSIDVEAKSEQGKQSRPKVIFFKSRQRRGKSLKVYSQNYFHWLN